MKKIRKIIGIIMVGIFAISAVSGCAGCAAKPIADEVSSVETLEEPKEPTSAQSAPIEAETEVPVETEILTETEMSEEGPAGVSEFSSCVVLDEEHCGKGERFFLFEDEDWVTLAFDLVEGTEIYSPFDGLLYIIEEITLEDGQVSKGIDVFMWPAREEVMRRFIFFNVIPEETFHQNQKIDLKYIDNEGDEEDLMIKMIVVEKGELIGRAKTGSVWNWRGKGYNLEIYIYSFQGVPPYRENYLPENYLDMEFVREFFPYI